jgi:hypothetical protein
MHFCPSSFSFSRFQLIASCDKKMLLAIAAVFFLLISSNEAHTQGTVTVDTFTFQKILQNFDVVLAKFDDKFRM